MNEPFLTNKERLGSLLRGFASITFFPTSPRLRFRILSPEEAYRADLKSLHADWEALASDWAAAGQEAARQIAQAGQRRAADRGIQNHQNSGVKNQKPER